MFVEDLRWQSPANTIISGPSFSGKTTLIDKIIRKKNILIKDGQNKKVILYYLSDQKIYQKWEDDNLLVFKAKGVPDSDSFIETVNFYGKSGAIVIFDDLGADIKSHSKFFRELFLVFTHHMKLNVFLILHNIFPQGLRELSLNSHRFLITYNPRDSLGISALSRQCFPGTKNFLASVYKEIGKMKYGYLVLDFHQETNPVLRVTSNWFGESGNYIMAFQESGACSSVPYKCLHIISSELYNSLVGKTECSDDGNSNANNASSNSSASFQNNFYPQNNLLSSGYHGGHDRFDPDDDDYDPGRGRHPQLEKAPPTHLPPATVPTRPPVPQDDTISPQHSTNDDGATSNIIEPADDVPNSPSINASINAGDMENLNKIDTTTDNTNTQQHSYPTVLKDRLQKRKKKNKKPYSDSGVRRKTPISSMIIPKKDENINRKQEPMDASTAPLLSHPPLTTIPSQPSHSVPNPAPSSFQDTPSVSNPLPPPSIKKLPPTSHSSVTSFVPSKDGPKLSKTTRKLKDEVKWNPHNDHQEVKIRKPKKIKAEPKKRVLKFERNIPKIEDEIDEQMDVNHIEHIPLNEDEKMNISHDELPKKKSKPNIRIRTDIFDKPPDEVVKPKIRVRSDLFEEKKSTKKNLGKPKIRVRTDLFEENKSTKTNLNKLKVPISTKALTEKNKKEIKALREKNKKEIANNVRNFFAKNKAANNTKFKDLPINVVKREKKHQIPKLKKSSSTEENDATMTEVKPKIEKKFKHDSDDDIVMTEVKTEAKSGGSKRKTKNAIVKKRAIKKEIIEKGKNTKLSHNIKREMIKAEMMNERDNAKSKRNKTKVTKGIKRKNHFGTKPTGYIKFIKKGKNDEDDSDKEDKAFKKKFSGSGFNIWKF